MNIQENDDNHNRGEDIEKQTKLCKNNTNWFCIELEGTTYIFTK